jgi:hypothetical protein
MAYISSPPYGDAWKLALAAQTVGAVSPASREWREAFQLEPGGSRIVGYDPDALRRIALAAQQRMGGSLQWGGVGIPATHPLADRAREAWRALLSSGNQAAAYGAVTVPIGAAVTPSNTNAARPAPRRQRRWVKPAAIGAGIAAGIALLRKVF